MPGMLTAISMVGALAAAGADVSAGRAGFGWGAVPFVAYSSDDGVAYGAVGTLYWYQPPVEPYRYALTLQFFMTTKWVQYHRVKFDAVEVADLPLRLWGDIGFYATISQAFCGFGNAVSCDPALARRTAAAQQLTGAAADGFVDRYYQNRFMQPYALVNGRWRFTPLPHKIEAFAGWRGSYYLTGDFGELAPYPGSLYARYFPDGENGLASVLQAGIMLDSRDNEAAPRRGYWIEGSLRGAAPFIGSRWTYGGANATLRGFVPLDRRRQIVLAGRLVLDGAVGELPVQEMARVGGATDYVAFGGEYMGRGLRSQRVLGRIKLLEQTELRWRVWGFRLLDQFFDLSWLGFVDAALVGYDWTDWRGDPLGAVWGGGGGLRLAWNRDFVIRCDLAVSPVESRAPALYLNLGHVF
ncbi:MAG: BamA/TamA family outer membrane protein [Deltaproteobacteria bacterium]|nr:BamA/TamA family outer membrane protein [Deltaproteobacteria bacterium]